jgi:hypothetical protein
MVTDEELEMVQAMLDRGLIEIKGGEMIILDTPQADLVIAAMDYLARKRGAH